MQFLTLSRRRTDAFPPEAFTPELSNQEAHRVKELYASGILRQVWRRADVAGAVILWEAGSEAEVREALNSLPLQGRDVGDFCGCAVAAVSRVFSANVVLVATERRGFDGANERLFRIPRAASASRTL
jgi:muconolactone delta-isomerase